MSIFNQIPPTPKEEEAPPKEEGESLTNLKAEMNRKFSNAENQISELSRINQILAEQLRQVSNPPPKREQVNLRELAVDDPDAYARVVAEQAGAAAQAQFDANQAKVNRQNQVFNDILFEFPEAANPSHELVKRATEIFSAFSGDEKLDPRSYKTAVYQAASEQGVRPKSKRKASDDDFTLGSRGTAARVDKKQKIEISDDALAFAKALGRPVDDPKYIERLKVHAQRDNWKDGR